MTRSNLRQALSSQRDERRAFARHHVEWGRQLIARQRQYIKELKESGRDTEAADKFLLELERSQKIFEYDLAALEIA